MGVDNCGIYCIKSPSGKLYIGSSNNISSRWKKHIASLKRGDHHNTPLQRVWVKYEGNLEFSKLLICSPENLLLYEQQYLDFYKPSFNILQIADRPVGVKRTENTKQKISQSLVGNSRAKANKGKIRTEEFKTNVGNFFRNTFLTEAHKKKISNAKTGLIFSDEHKANLSKAFTGRVHSEETKKKISLALKAHRAALV